MSKCLTEIAKDSKGVVMVEFIIVFMPIFTFFLCIVQMGLLYTATLGVQHAATKSVRSAAVVMPDDPKSYEDSPVNQLGNDGDCEESESSLVNQVLSLLDQGDSVDPSDCKGGPRAAAVRFTGVVSMLPFSSRISDVAPSLDVRGNAVSSIAMMYMYSLAATAVNFPTEPGAETLKKPGDTFDGKKDITVRVTHLFHCQIPIAKTIICKSRLDRFWDRIRMNQDEPTEDMQALKELQDGTSLPSWLKIMLFTNNRFFFIRKEASFPMQGANYDYQ